MKMEVLMETIDITKMSSRGQIALPKSIREYLKLKSGQKFLIFANGDTLVLKRIQEPGEADLDAMFARSQKLAREKGLKPRDVENVIGRVRNESCH
jgi:AbrB family looped-hinge helix DNA binding protein